GALAARHHGTARLAQRHRPGAGDRDHQPGAGDHRRIHALVPRRRHAADPAFPWDADPGRPAIPFLWRMVDSALPCARPCPARAVDQPARRLAARRPESEVAMTTPVLSARDLKVEFPTRRGTLTAIDGVSFDIAPGEVLGVVGESGAGKSITGTAVI